MKKLAERLSLFANAIRMQNELGKDGGQNALSLLDCPVSNKRGKYTAEEIEKTVNRAIRLGGLFGGLNTCLSRSVIRCRIMRQQGIDARVMFGLSRDGEKLSGHTWVVWPDGPEHTPDASRYDDLEIHPSPEKYPGWIPDLHR